VYVLKMQSDQARKCQSYIEEFRASQARLWEQELFKQRKRLADAQRKLQSKETKAARNDERISTDKIETLTAKLTSLRSDQLRSTDSRIFQTKYFVPIVYIVVFQPAPIQLLEHLPGDLRAVTLREPLQIVSDQG
jgi:hypothetical protein